MATTLHSVGFHGRQIALRVARLGKRIGSWAMATVRPADESVVEGWRSRSLANEPDSGSCQSGDAKAPGKK